MGLREVRSRAERSFHDSSKKISPDEKKKRRKIFDELKALEAAWSRLSPEALELLRETAATTGMDEEYVGALARLARLYGADSPGRNRLRPHYSAAKALIAYWRQYREVTVTLYAPDGTPTRPSRTVRWLGYELQRLDATLTRDQSRIAAFGILKKLKDADDVPAA